MTVVRAEHANLKVAKARGGNYCLWHDCACVKRGPYWWAWLWVTIIGHGPFWGSQASFSFSFMFFFSLGSRAVGAKTLWKHGLAIFTSLLQLIPTSLGKGSKYLVKSLFLSLFCKKAKVSPHSLHKIPQRLSLSPGSGLPQCLPFSFNLRCVRVSVQLLLDLSLRVAWFCVVELRAKIMQPDFLVSNPCSRTYRLWECGLVI